MCILIWIMESLSLDHLLDGRGNCMLKNERRQYNVTVGTHHPPPPSLLLSHFFSRPRRLFGEALGVEQFDHASSSLDGVTSMAGGFRVFALTADTSVSLPQHDSGDL